MSRVDFYLLPDANRANLHTFACKLAEKAWQQGNRIFIQTDSLDESRHLDDLMWTFKDGSFVPHGVQDDVHDDEQPILISHMQQPGDQFQLMINLSSQLPQSTFERIAEVLNEEPTRKQTGRDHYKHYRELGLDLHHHQM